jgi:hypothetical protein
LFANDCQSFDGPTFVARVLRRSRCSYLARDHGRLRATRPSDPSTLVRPLLPMRGGYEADSYPDSGASAHHVLAFQNLKRFLTSIRGGATALPSGLVQVSSGSLGMRRPGSTMALDRCALLLRLRRKRVPQSRLIFQRRLRTEHCDHRPLEKSPEDGVWRSTRSAGLRQSEKTLL